MKFSEKMYTVILPTMWRSAAIGKILPLVDAHPLVSKIILINNDDAATPKEFREARWRTLEEVNLGKNIYVNPAWELGISMAETDIVCLMSDDVYFDPRVFDFLNNKMGIDQGCVGPDFTCIHGATTSPDMSLIHNDKQMYGYGTLLFLNKYNYVRIPKEFKIFYGDTWIFHTHMNMGKTPRSLVNFYIRTKLETTSGSKEFAKQTEIEHKAYKEKYNWNK